LRDQLTTILHQPTTIFHQLTNFHIRRSDEVLYDSPPTVPAGPEDSSLAWKASRTPSNVQQSKFDSDRELTEIAELYHAHMSRAARETSWKHPSIR
jgi:hypothetical protein